MRNLGFERLRFFATSGSSDICSKIKYGADRLFHKRYSPSALISRRCGPDITRPFGLKFLLTVFVAILFSAASTVPAKAHEVFKLLSDGVPSAEVSQPLLREPAVYEDQNSWIFEAVDGKFYVVPKELSLVQSNAATVLGANIQSRRQDHLIILMVHATTLDSVRSSIEAFRGLGGGPEVLTYPLHLREVVLVTDPQDHLVLKFNSISARSAVLSDQLMLLTIVQSAGTRNVSGVKSLFANGISIVGYFEILTEVLGGEGEAKILSIPLEANSINVTSQGL